MPTNFYGVIRPGYAKRDQEFSDRYAFGRRWMEVRDNPEAQNHVVINHVVFGWPKAEDSDRTRTTSLCRHCEREFIDPVAKDGTGIFCPGCEAAQMPPETRPNPSAKWCPVGTYHSFPAGVTKCAHCQRTREQLGLAPAPELVEAR